MGSTTIVEVDEETGLRPAPRSSRRAAWSHSRSEGPDEPLSLAVGLRAVGPRPLVPCPDLRDRRAIGVLT